MRGVNKAKIQSLDEITSCTGPLATVQTWSISHGHVISFALLLHDFNGGAEVKHGSASETK